LAEANHNLGLVFNEKADKALKEKNFNTGEMYSLLAVSKFETSRDEPDHLRVLGKLLGTHDSPIVFSLRWLLSFSFSPDGKTLASGSWDKTISLWDVSSGRELKRLDWHADRICSVCFSPDGKTLALGSWEKTISLWDVISGKELKRLEGHTEFIMSVSLCLSKSFQRSLQVKRRLLRVSIITEVYMIAGGTRRFPNPEDLSPGAVGS
jgi:WD40 repeat protein